MSKLYVMCGLPGSGKTSWAKEHLPDAVICSADNVREMLYGDASIQGDGKKVFAELNRQVHNLLAQGYDVVYDTTAINRRTRKPIFNNFDVEIECIYMATPIEICKERNANRARVVPETVIDNMATRFSVPTLGEGFSKITTVKAQN